jgi:glucokinase
LAKKGRRGWATVVKMVTRLEEAGLLHCVGKTPPAVNSIKSPAVYDLTGQTPLAIGIDVAYSTTTIILTNLRHTVLQEQRCETPVKPDAGQLQEFLLSTYARFTKKYVEQADAVAGIGIGVPRWLVKDGRKAFASLAEELETQLGLPVRIEECTARNYAMYKKWVGRAFSLNDFILMTIRNGIGAGIFYQGGLIRGTHGLAGELGHLTIEKSGLLCRCGKYGCLETLVNQDLLYREYIENILHETPQPSLLLSDSDAIHQGLSELFSLAHHGNPEASMIVAKAAQHIGMEISALLMVLDIPNILITANFGPDGAAMIPYIKEEVDSRIISEIEYSIEYYPLEQDGFAYGAALLILQDYFTELVSPMPL